jgi:2-oxoglutarate ferredoxin oxidoreductase subunit alpha
MFEIARDFPEENILVVEMNKGQYRGEVERAMRNRPQVLLHANGRPITPAEIETKIRSMHHG